MALVTTLSNLIGDDEKLCWKWWKYDIWQALASLAQDLPLELAPSTAAPALKILWEEEIWDLAVAICRPETAVAAIFSNLNLAEENRNLERTLVSELIYKIMCRYPGKISVQWQAHGVKKQSKLQNRCLGKHYHKIIKLYKTWVNPLYFNSIPFFISVRKNHIFCKILWIVESTKSNACCEKEKRL